MQQPITSFTRSRLTVESYGKPFAYDPNKPTLEEELLHIEEYAKRAGASNVLWQRFSTRQNCEGRFLAVSRSWLPRNQFAVLYDAKRYNGIYFSRPGDSIACVTRDCPVLILWKESRKRTDLKTAILAIHCSRDALQGADIGQPEMSIITRSVSACTSEWQDPRDVHGFITLGIAPEHFANDRYPDIVSALTTHWGEHVVPDKARSTIDLVALIKAQLASMGINPSNIEHDGLDTYSDERLASTRRGHGGYHNLVLITSR